MSSGATEDGASRRRDGRSRRVSIVELSSRVRRWILEGSAVRAPAASAAARSAAGKFSGRRKVKPRLLAVVDDGCTGCAGAPVCQLYCPVDECMVLVPAADAYPFGRIWVDPLRCVGCRKCVARGPEAALLDGCPWDAIRLVPLGAWEHEHGELAY